MRFFRNLPIGRKLTLIIMVLSGVALLLAGTTLAIYEQVSLRRTMERDFAILTDIFDDNIAPGLAFNDAAAIGQTLNTLQPHQSIVAAGVYDRSGALVAQYRRSDAPKGFVFPTDRLTGQRIEGKRLDTFKDIVFAGEKIGVVYISAGLEKLRERAWLHASIVGGSLIACSLVTLVLTGRVQRVISGPIEALAHTVATVTAEKNFALRAHKQSDDELGRLIDGFNEMLAQIQARDTAVQQARDTLEEHVRERTRELQQEVTEHRRAEEALRESHQRFEIVTRATTDVIWDWRLESDTVWFNENYQSLFGYGAEHVPSSVSGWLACIHPEDAAGVQQSIAAVLAGSGQVWSAEYRYRKHDGAYAIVHDRGWVLRDSRGQPWRMIGAMQDISERKQAQAEAAREKDRLQLIFESVPVGICLDHVLPDGKRSRLINTAHLTICGLKREDLMDGLFQRITHPDDRPRQAVLRQHLDAGLIGKYSLEKRYFKPDGQAVWVVFTMQRQRFADGSHQDLSTVVDITALKQAQEETAREKARFKFIFESVPVGISLVTGDAAKMHLVNPAHERITGVAAADSSVPGIFMRASHPDDYRRQMELAQPFITGEADHYSLEKRYLHPDGRVLWARLTSHKFIDATMGHVQSVTTLVDITEHKLAEARLAETHRQLLAASRQAGMAEVATGVLHNVGNVLNSVNVSATLVMDNLRESKTANLVKISAMLQERAGDVAHFLASDPRGQKIPGYLITLAADVAAERKAVTEELGHLRKNIDHIKDIVAMQQSHARISGVFETLAVADLVDDALRLNASSLARHDVHTVRDFQARPVVTTDKHKVVQILVNLVRNAKHACDEAGPGREKTITVRTTADEHGVTIAVIDNGVGIPAANLTRIFAHGFTTRKTGHGFGLHSGALAAKELGGELSVASDGAGKGATFTLKLPYAPKGVAV